jgi:ribonuclease D
MAIGWLLVLQSVPWTEVMRNAPKVADGAKKLWNAIANKKPPSPETVSPTEQATLSPEAQAIAILQTQVAALEIAAADLHNQMLASSELIKALAEQNTQLVQRIEANRMRVFWLIVATVVLGVLAVSTLVFLFVR